MDLCISQAPRSRGHTAGGGESFGSLTGKTDVLRSSTWLGGGHRKIDLPPVGGRGQRFASHQFDRRPILTKEACCVVVIVCFHSNAVGLSARAVRYLKVKIEADCFRIFFDRSIIAAHWCPPFCVAHFRFLIWIFVRRDYGTLELARSPTARRWGGPESARPKRHVVVGTGALLSSFTAQIH